MFSYVAVGQGGKNEYGIRFVLKPNTRPEEIYSYLSLDHFKLVTMGWDDGVTNPKTAVFFNGEILVRYYQFKAAGYDFLELESNFPQKIVRHLVEFIGPNYLLVPAYSERMIADRFRKAMPYETSDTEWREFLALIALNASLRPDVDYLAYFHEAASRPSREIRWYVHSLMVQIAWPELEPLIARLAAEFPESNRENMLRGLYHQLRTGLDYWDISAEAS